MNGRDLAMSSQPGQWGFSSAIAMIVLSVVLLAIGFVLRRRGRLVRGHHLLLWVLLSLVPIAVVMPLLYEGFSAVVRADPPG